MDDFTSPPPQPSNLGNLVLFSQTSKTTFCVVKSSKDDNDGWDENYDCEGFTRNNDCWCKLRKRERSRFARWAPCQLGFTPEWKEWICSDLKCFFILADQKYTTGKIYWFWYLFKRLIIKRQHHCTTVRVTNELICIWEDKPQDKNILFFK